MDTDRCPDSNLLSIQEFARRANYSPRHVRRKIHRGDIKAIRPFGRKWLIPESEFERLEKGTEEVKPEELPAGNGATKQPAGVLLEEAREGARPATQLGDVGKELSRPLPRKTRPEERERRRKAEEEPPRRMRSSDLKTLEELADI